ncbi:hypothetical protein GUJ93_ZPchr0005g16146 [Zizania palustris]|uniref:Uncharacterized protein n=1 Tax=Zizania palustris TaxID=103762 RepID=A0A8J5SGA9_ZIZPA|nr:hypothetical protein GUJ93_ZPchr0005g16146 [Zizania palustris]
MSMAAPARAVGAAPRAGRGHALLSSTTPHAVATAARLAGRAGGRRAVVVVVSRASGDGEGEPADSPWGGRLVDEDMATLRQRIRQAREEEEYGGGGGGGIDAYGGGGGIDAYGGGGGIDAYGGDIDAYGGGAGIDAYGGGASLPAEWTELERRHHGSYIAGVHISVGLLQAVLMSVRPGLGAGLLVLLLLSVPASVLLASAQLVRAVHAIASVVFYGNR